MMQLLKNDAAFSEFNAIAVIMFRQAKVLHTMLLLMTTEITKNRKFSSLTYSGF
jgi:hypothetical protein